MKKSLYGLKQSPHQRYKKFDYFMLDHGFKRLNEDHWPYIKRYQNENSIVLLLYVDDMLIVGKDKLMTNKLKEELNNTFAMKDLGPVKKILGIQIICDRKRKKLCLSQQQYLGKFL